MWYLRKTRKLNEVISKLLNGKNFDEAEAYVLMSQISRRNVPLPLVKKLLLSLNKKGVTAEELAGFARALRKDSIRVKAKSDKLVDVCGTGGDKTNTFNVSTTAAFIAAGAGVKVAKHGNSKITSQCGSSDVLRELGINIYLNPNSVARCIDEVGIGFIYAPFHHRTFQYVSQIRKEIGERTVFNLLGPLINPARVERQVLGVYEPKWTKMLCRVLKKIGSRRAYVVCGEGGLDEFSTIGATEVADLNFGIITHYGVFPEDLGIKKVSINEIRGGRVSHNAKIISDCLGTKILSSYQDIALLNASAAIVVSDLAINLRDGLEMARNSLYSGSALAKLKLLREFSSELSTA